MNGIFEYLDKDGNFVRVYDSNEIPYNASELILWNIPVKEGPHTQDDHDEIDRGNLEFARLLSIIYPDGKKKRTIDES